MKNRAPLRHTENSDRGVDKLKGDGAKKKSSKKKAGDDSPTSDDIIHPKRELNGNEYFEAVREMRKSSKHWNDLLDEDFAEGERGEAWDEMLSNSQDLCEKYAWAVPDERALRILSNFGPLIEIGAGKGYWARLLRDHGVDVLAYDKYPADKSLAWTKVKKGGPEMLAYPAAKGRTLMLCYPDEQESMAAQCLDHYSGDIILHVGEMIFTGTAMGTPVAPFGRTSSADFQVSLAETFHCLLVARLSETYPLSRDCISVWKRTKFVAGREHQSMVADEPDPDFMPDQKKRVHEDDIIDNGKGKKKNKKSKESVEESAVEFISLSDLEALRGNATTDVSKGKKKKSEKKSAPVVAEDDGVEFMDMNDLNALREAALDMQYDEENESRWASIPDDEQLPIDRAASCLRHLL